MRAWAGHRSTCMRDLRTSMGYTDSQELAPARPPAASMHVSCAQSSLNMLPRSAAPMPCFTVQSDCLRRVDTHLQ